MVLVELTAYCAYLAASDGTISSDEAALIAEYTGLDFTPQQWCDVIVDNGINTSSFSEHFPEILKLLVSADIAWVAKGVIEDIDHGSASRLLDCYKILGGALISLDGLKGQEKSDWVAYNKMLVDGCNQFIHDLQEGLEHTT